MRVASGRILAVLWLVLAAWPASAEDSLSAARVLYASAAYEDALAMLDGLKAVSPEGDLRTIEQYRAFCLLALGRADAAEQAIVSVFTIDPTFTPAADDLSPRLLAAFSDVRQRMLPVMLKQRYQAARATYERRSYPEAADQFAQVLAVLEHLDKDEEMAGDPLLADLALLSAGFRDLSLAAEPPAPAVLPTLPAPIAEVAPPAPPEQIIYGPDNTDVVPPIAEQQFLPRFQGPHVNEARGVLDIVVDETGAVILAEMTASINPTYDRLAAQAARSWQFQPAALNGVPVKYRKRIVIDIER